MFQPFDEFLEISSINIPILGFVTNLLASAMLSLILKNVYVRYGKCLSNRKAFGNNFIIITLTTMLIITVVKSSLALSLGLVGALSIIRFRVAIKEPEELAYLFLTIGIGLGFGADQGAITTVAFIIICLILVIISKMNYVEDIEKNISLTISSDNPKNVNIKKIKEVLSTHCSEIDLRRIDETEEIIEASFLVGFDDLNSLNEAKIKLQKLDKSLKLTFLDTNGLI